MTTTMQPDRATLSMQAIADLAQVKRPVVSVWRTRYVDSDRPFPAPVQDDPLRFDAHAVAEWLEATGRGNNEHALIENLLHADLRARLFADPEPTSALLLLAELLGEPLGNFFPDELIREYVEEDLPSSADEILDWDALDEAIATGNLAGVDAVAEAAFSARQALDLLVTSFTDRDAAWAPEAFTQQAQVLLGTVCAELYRDAPARHIVPNGIGGMVLVDALLPYLTEQERPVFDYREEALGTPEDRAAWRRLRAHGYDARPCSEGAAPVLHLMAWQNPSTSEEFLTMVEDCLLTLAPGDCMVVVGPSATMIDTSARHVRTEFLRPRGGYLAPLRYCTDLPKGMSRFGGRRRLALWVFAEPLTEQEQYRAPVTVVGTHAGRRPDLMFTSDLAADVAVSTEDLQTVRAHEFRTSIPLATESFLCQDEFTAPAWTGTVVNGGDLLASYWELDGEAATGLRLVAGTPHLQTIPFTEATASRAKDIPGNRIPAMSLSSPAPGTVTVLGAPEIRQPGLYGRRAIDRLVLEEVAHQAQFTEPGDVIYVATGGSPAAIVDRAGGNVVEAPARTLRCLPPDHGHALVPDVVAADICAEDRRDRKTWQLRLVPTRQVDTVVQATTRIRRRRDELYEKLARLDQLERTLLDGLTSNALHEDHGYTNPDDSKDAL